MSKKSVDVLVVGAGPVGLFLANELLRQGMTCRIIDKKAGLSIHSKALGLHIRTLEVLHDTGHLDAVLAKGHVVSGVLFKSKGKVIVDATFAEVDAPIRHLIDLPQNETEKVLHDALTAKKLKVEWEKELINFTQDTHGVTATLKTAAQAEETIFATWIVACDGAHSTMRHLLNIPFQGDAYPEHWWLADLYIDWQQPTDRMLIYLAGDGPMACFPMGNERYRVVVTAPKQGPKDPSLDDIKAVFEQRCSDAATLSDPVWITGFNIHHRQIQAYRHHRVFFAGDAAHIHSPMGGQGLNTGIQDAYNLAWKLALVTKGVSPNSLLESYHAERYPVGKKVLKETDRMTKMAVLKNPLAIKARNHIASWATRLSAIKNKLASNIAELTVSYPKSPIVRQQGRLKVKAGELLPYLGFLNLGDPVAKSVYTLLQGTQHHLLLFVGQSAREDQTLFFLAEEISKQYGELIVTHLVTSEVNNHLPIKEHMKVWIDPGQQAHHRLGIKKPACLLIRPDKYIAYLQTSVSLSELQRYLRWIFI